MIGERATFAWRVHARDASKAADAFDALILPTDGRTKRFEHPTRLVACSIPYESELPDTPLTLVVRARPAVGPLIVECETFAPDGTRLVYGRGSQPLVVIVRSAHGIIVSGLPFPEVPDESPSPSI